MSPTSLLPVPASSCPYPADLAVTDELLDQYRSIIYSADSYQVIDWTIYDIVMEESKSYFAGDKTAAEVSAIIQNRVQTYLDEK